MSSKNNFFKWMAQTSDSPMSIEVDSAQGMYVMDVYGKKYMDLIAGIAVNNLGHRHPAVVAAIQHQIEKHMHVMVYGEFIQSVQVNLAQEIASLLPSNLSSTFFVNSGSEAVEGALKLAKRYTARTQLVSCVNAYHGSTHGALSVMGNEALKQKFRPLLPDIRFIRFNEEADLVYITTQTAAVIIEPIQGEAGVIIPSDGYLQALRDRCNEVGCLLIFDEVQTGIGRTGTFFAFEHWHVVPDILCLAKGLGGGMPIGAFVSSPEIQSCLTHHPVLGHITTFGGHPLSCAAALATLRAIQEEDLLSSISEKEALFKQLLVHPSIKEVRGKGLMFALEFVDFATNKRIIDGCLSQGIITDWFLFNDKSLRIAPPLIITLEEIKQACLILLKVIAENNT